MRHLLIGILALIPAPASAATLTVFEMAGPQADRIGRTPEEMVPQLLEQQRRSGLAQGTTVQIIPDGEDHVETVDRSLGGASFLNSRNLSVTRTASTGNLLQIWHAGTPGSGVRASVRITRKSGFANFSGEISGTAEEVRADGTFRLNGDVQAAVNYTGASGSRGAQAVVLLYEP